MVAVDLSLCSGPLFQRTLRTGAWMPRGGRPKIEQHITINESGLAKRQYERLLKEIIGMSENLNARITDLETEVADVHTSVNLIATSVEGLRTSLDQATAALATAQTTIDGLTADVALKQEELDALAQSVSEATVRVGDATANLDAADEALESISGEQ